jgi:hypothetical protein
LQGDEKTLRDVLTEQAGEQQMCCLSGHLALPGCVAKPRRTKEMAPLLVPSEETISQGIASSKDI